MTKRDLLAIAIKITGLVQLMELLYSLPSTVRYFLMFNESKRFVGPGYDPRADMLLTFTSLVLIATIGVLLIACGDGLARLLAGRNGEAALPSLSASARPWFGIASRVVGLIAIADGLPLLTGALTKAWVVTSLDTEGWAVLDKFSVLLRNLTAVNQDVAAYRGLAGVVIGVCLIFGAERLSRWLFPKRRKAAAQVTEDAAE